MVSNTGTSNTGMSNQPTIMPDILKKDNFNFTWLGGENKKSPEVMGRGWQNKIYRFDDPTLIKYIEKGYNYGVQSNNSYIEIDGEKRFLIIIDFDKKEFQDLVINNFPETFTTTSGSPKKCHHLWLASDNNMPFKIKDEVKNTLADIIGEGNQVVAPGSIHLSGSKYSIVKDIPIAFMPYAEIEAILKPLDKSPKKILKPKKQFVPKGISDNIRDEIMSKISMKEVLTEVGIDTTKNPTNCFDHSSRGGKCLSWNEECCHCFHCDNSWNKFSLIREAKKLSDKETFDWFAEKTNMLDKLKDVRMNYIKNKNMEEDKIKSFAIASKVFTAEGQAQIFSDIQPIFYDRNEMWWLWDSKYYRWEIVDEVDILNMIHDATGEDVITPKNRTIILNSLKQAGRKKMPRQIEKTWIQFGDTIYDILSEKKFKVSPNFFVTNPLPYNLHLENKTYTPTIDRIFEEWVGKEYVKTLYEIIAYCMIPDYPINRLFCFIGAGLNGKTKFLELLRKFIGSKNCCTTELDVLLTSRFEITRLHKKLACMMGETNFSEMSKTSILKKLTGGDLIGFEYKNKNPFDEKNYAKVLIATNNLPATTDKTIGFYRRWMIVDFPNQFTEAKDILLDIPEEEYCALTSKCCLLLKELLTNRKFEKEGTIEERTKKFEDRSNPLEKFIREFTVEDYKGLIWKNDFSKKLNSWCREKRFREISEVHIGKKMRDLGIKQTLKTAPWDSSKKFRAWEGLKFKEEIQYSESLLSRKIKQEYTTDQVEQVEHERID